MTDAAMREQQTTCNVLMIRPALFAGNPQTAVSNLFQRIESPDPSIDPQVAAASEFDALEGAMLAAGVRVIAVEDCLDPPTPDALFPNNWVSFHADGTAVLYPMLAPNRRLERRGDILAELGEQHGFRLDRIVDLTHGEAHGRFLEGTGSLVLDRQNHIVYACRSPRTDPGMLDEFARKLEYEPLLFRATDALGVPIYHTNVMLSVGERHASVCVDSIVEPDRNRVLHRLQSTSHEIVELSRAQMSRFAGNTLELRGVGGDRILVLSSAALDSLDARQRQIFGRLGLDLIASPLPTIERLGGGSARCMIAEIHLPSRRG